MGYALAAFSRVGHTVGQFFTPKSAYALHLGVGGIISGGEDGLGGGFSYITAGFPLTESIVSGDAQTGTVNMPLAQQLKVVVTSVHLHTVPVENEPVRCDVIAGGGSLGTLGTTSATVMTLSDGTAKCPTLILGPNPVTNSVKVTALNIDDGVLAAEDFGEGLSIQPLRGAVTFSATATAGTLGFVSVTKTDGQTPFDNSTLTIDGSNVSFIATIQNPGSALGSSNAPVILQNWVQQGDTRRAAGGTVLTCASQGVLPNGMCVQNWSALANDIQSSGGGTFTAGSATLILELWQGSVEGTLLATKSIPITLSGTSQQTGTIQGLVRDASGAALPGVTVSASFGDAAPYAAVTNADGFYQITQLPPTAYSVSISVSGFGAQQATVTPGGTTTVNFSPTQNP
jgi:hypothetical protein